SVSGCSGCRHPCVAAAGRWTHGRCHAPARPVVRWRAGRRRATNGRTVGASWHPPAGATWCRARRSIARRSTPRLGSEPAYTRRMNLRMHGSPRVAAGRIARRLSSLALSLLLAPAFAAAPATSSSAADTLQQRIAACTACHGERGEGSPGSGFFPRLAGKPAGYLVRQLQDFQNGLRKYAPMEYTVRGLDPAYLREIAEYFAAQQVPYARSPRPAVSAATLQRGEQLVSAAD